MSSAGPLGPPSASAAAHTVRTTNLVVDIGLRAEQIPTCIYNLLETDEYPLFTCRVRNEAPFEQRVRLQAEVQHYSSIDSRTETIGAAAEKVCHLRPPLLPESMRGLHSTTTASARLRIDLLPGEEALYDSSYDVRLLAATAAPLATRDPSTGEWTDLTFGLATFVTPGDPAVQGLLQEVARMHPRHRLAANPSRTALEVETQVQAVFEVLRTRVSYVPSGEAFSRDPATVFQRVRLPRETLRDGVANCADGMVLFASVLAAFGLEPALVLVPGHALVAWRSQPGGPKAGRPWHFLDTTMLDQEYQKVRTESQRVGEASARILVDPDDRRWGFPRIWPLEISRARGISPIQDWQDPTSSKQVPRPRGPSPRTWYGALADTIVEWFHDGLGSWLLSERELRAKTLAGAGRVFATGVVLGVIVEFSGMLIDSTRITAVHLLGTAFVGVVHLTAGGLLCVILCEACHLVPPHVPRARTAVVVLLQLAGALPLALLFFQEPTRVALMLLDNFREPGRPYLRIAVEAVWTGRTVLAHQGLFWVSFAATLATVLLYLGYGLWRGVRAVVGATTWTIWPALGIGIAFDVLVVRYWLGPQYWNLIAWIANAGVR